MIYECEECNTALPAGVFACPKCGKGFDEVVPEDAETPNRGWQSRVDADNSTSTKVGTTSSAHNHVLPSNFGQNHWQKKVQHIISLFKQAPLLFGIVAVMVCLIGFVIYSKSLKPAFVGSSWKHTTSMGLPDGTYNTSVEIYNFNADGTGIIDAGTVNGRFGEDPELKPIHFTWTVGKDNNVGMNDAPVMSILCDGAPAESAFRYHWGVSDDHETLQMDNEEFSKVVQ